MSPIPIYACALFFATGFRSYLLDCLPEASARFRNRLPLPEGSSPRLLLVIELLHDLMLLASLVVAGSRASANVPLVVCGHLLLVDVVSPVLALGTSKWMRVVGFFADVGAGVLLVLLSSMLGNETAGLAALGAFMLMLPEIFLLLINATRTPPDSEFNMP